MSNAKNYFNEIIRRHIQSAINIQHTTVDICRSVAGNANAVEKLEDERYWRDFMPPLYNYLITAIEVFLEHYFIEVYRKSSGGSYTGKDEWLANMENFKANVTWASEASKKKIQKGFSFQRLDDVDVLYESALGKKLSNYFKYDLIKLMFAKRHLFTHRAGVIDEKFVTIYNQYHGSTSSERLDSSNVGKKAFIERRWLVDSIQEANEFVEHIDK